MVELLEITLIHAPVERCFDLARSIEVHLLGNTHSGEQAVALTRGAGESAVAEKTPVAGLIGMGESITWQARHFGVRQRLTSRITAFEPHTYFQDTMQRGAFRSMQHDHHFRALDPLPDGTPVTEMRDNFRFSAPLGPLGLIAERLVLRRYMTALLVERNLVIKRVAESGSWQLYLPHA